MNKTLIALVCLPFFTACVIHVNVDGNYQERQQVLELPATDLTNLIANTGAGSLTIIGEPNRSNIEVHATIYSYAENDVEVTLERRGNSARLEADVRVHFYNRNVPIIDLSIKVPDTFALTLNDGSGHTQITGLQGNLEITDGSGNIDIQGGHNITIVDGSGNLQITRATGNVEVKDGSGNIDVRGVEGNLAINDGSGNLEVQFISGTVEIDDGSGNIDIDQVGAITILEAGSGGLTISNVVGQTLVL